MILEPFIKINIGLNVLRKRKDGFHDIETVFYPDKSITDKLEVIRADDFSRTSSELFSKYAPEKISQKVSEDGKIMITIAGNTDWDPLSDLCVKAYKILDEKYNLPAVKIFLEKNIPACAGLGGGSSDCANTIKALNEIFSLGMSLEEMKNTASQIGSDCAFFLYDRAMLGMGRGETLIPIEMNLGDYDIKIIVPEGCSVSTAWAYGSIIPREDLMPVADAVSHKVEEWKYYVQNSFEPAVMKKFPEIAEAKAKLYEQGAVYASLSGSGAAVFGLFRK